tara:strand:+ start:2660 stop:3466 length:807 start_codon:yes stop_codon:yes gene_type:complete
MTIETKSPAKINLYLKVLSKREDGYHNIKTLFQFIDLYDVLIFKKSREGISIKSKNNIFNQDNTVLQAANKMSQYLSNSYGVSIEVNKNIPTGSGLGGASSNAASTIIALNKLWDLKLSKEKMLSIGKEIGADVPFFIFGENAFGEGLGELLKKTEPITKNILVIDPQIHNSSKKMFDLYDLSINEKIKEQFSQNSFWSIFLKKNHKVKEFYDENINDYDLKLSGSGSCMFIEYCEKEEINKILKKIPSNWRFFLCKPLQYSPICYIK